MKKAVFLMLAVGLYSAAYSQNDLLIKKTIDMKMPGMPDLSGMMSKTDGRGAGIAKSRTTTVMVKGSRLRVDSNVPTIKDMGLSTGSREVSYIQQCDLGRTVHLDPKKKSYSISRIAGGGREKRNTDEKAKKGGIVDVSVEVSDTNERRNMYGFIAKHLRSTTTMTPGPGSCMKQPMSIVDEGWYVDLPTYACEIHTEDTLDSMQETDAGCVDEIRVKPGANMHLGFPVQQTRTFSMNGFSMQMIETTISLDRADLDAALFEIPTDFHPSSDSDTAESTASQAPASTAANTQPTNPSTSTASQYPSDWQNKPLPQMVQVSDTGTTPKAPGTIRIGIITPTADMGQGFEGIDAGQIVQAAFLDYLKADKIEAVPISSGVLILEQAKVKQCDYLLYVDLKRKKGGGGGFLKQMVMTNLACMGGNAACAAASAASQATMAGRLKNKDEITLEYHVNKQDGSSATASTTLKQKAQKDGDDVLSPMIADASKSILASIKPN